MPVRLDGGGTLAQAPASPVSQVSKRRASR
jgi:hypothetical protein